MHLKKIEIQGFKSFADKIEIKFKEGITAIVGPNGSGKSNISDAIKWVLGEQSVKSLRGKKMQDVIFAGTDKRKPVGYTEVTITFDNKEGTIPVDYQEVAITRRMFRSGESEYYLNKNSCRLRDIKELFMDTGVGTDGYSIIGQGKVDEILSGRPEDRRAIFEEAAGIVKYKTKKIEAEKKLEKTDENLERIKDILNELQKQSKTLERQADRAHNFIELSNKLKELEVNLYIREIDRIQGDIEESKREKTELQSNINNILKGKNKIEEDFISMNIKIEKMDEKISITQDEKIEILNKSNENKNQLKLLNEKEKYNIKDRERSEKEINKSNIEIKELEKTKLYILEKERVNTEKLKEIKKDFNRKSLVLNKLNNELELNEKIMEKDKNENISLYNEIVDKKSKINSFASFEENINKRIMQIKNSIETLIEENIKNEKSLKVIKEKELGHKEDIIKYNKSLMNVKLIIKEAENKLDSIIKEINQNKIDLQDRISNFNLLKNMEEDYEGYYRSVKNLILACKKDKELGDKVIGIVADLIKVEERYEKAINVTLGGRLQNVVTLNENHAKILIDYLRKNNLGRVTFLPISTIKGRPVHISSKDREDYKILGLASELISYDEEYKNIMESLLGRTIIVEDLQLANKVAKKFNYSFRIVTLQGDIINPGGSITGGSLPKVSGNLLNRKHRIEKLKEDIDKLSKFQRNFEKEKVVLKSNLESNVNELKTQEKKLNDINIEIIKTENEENKYENELKRVNGSIVEYEEEINNLKLQSNQMIEDKDKLNKDITQLNKKSQVLKETIKKIELSLVNKKEIKENAEREVTDIKIQMSLLENKSINKREKIESVENEIKSKIELKKEKKKELIEGEKEINSILKEISYLKTNLEKFSKIEEEKEKNLKLLQLEKDKFMKNYYAQQDKLKEVNLRLGNDEKEKNHWDVKEAKQSVQLENINIKLLEDYELIYYEAKELLIKIEDLDNANKKVKKLKRKIKSLGTINLGSIEEYKEVSKRLEFISNQYKDLMDAKEDLQEVIKNMEVKMKKQFLSSFNQINTNFNEIFSVLFDGGRAELILEDMENVLTCGIEIQAQPPGKKLQNLSLLSGGEKSLAAVALLFSILQMRPTPFCVLDEIDASLDEANINRYTNYLKGFSDETQFIMITHRKSTMEMADVLYGVTMEEKGVSKMISIKLTDDLEEIAS